MPDQPRSNADIRLLFTTRIVRLFCYGFLSVVLALSLAQAGLSEKQIGLLFSLTLAGGLKIIYDLLLKRSFRRLKPPSPAM
jgi:hypothetical protein